MQLHVGEFNGTNATALIRWCLSPKEIAKITKLSDHIPKIIISIVALRDDGSFHFEENRIVRPVTAMATYISFRNPGKHLVVAGILDDNWVEDDASQKLAAPYERHAGYNDYRYELVDRISLKRAVEKNLPIIEDRFLLNEDMQANLPIEVDEKLFAPKPRDYELVNYWFDTKPLDQCHNRKRRFLAYFLTLTVLPLNYLFTSIWHVLTLTLLGSYCHLNWRWFLNPFDNTKKKHYSECYFSWFESSYKETKPLWRILLNWRSLVLMAGLSFVLIYMAEWLSYLIIIVAFLVLGALMFLGFVIKDKLNDYLSDKMHKWQQEANKEEKRQMINDLKSLNCKLIPQEVSLATLPNSKQTIRLRFYNLKTKVCRPFAGS